MDHEELWETIESLKRQIASLNGQLQYQGRRLDEAEAFIDGMRTAANALQAESSPRVPYTIGPGTFDFEPDPVFDLRIEKPR